MCGAGRCELVGGHAAGDCYRTSPGWKKNGEDLFASSIPRPYGFHTESAVPAISPRRTTKQSHLFPVEDPKARPRHPFKDAYGGNTLPHVSAPYLQGESTETVPNCSKHYSLAACKR